MGHYTWPYLACIESFAPDGIQILLLYCTVTTSLDVIWVQELGWPKGFHEVPISLHLYLYECSIGPCIWICSPQNLIRSLDYKINSFTDIFSWIPRMKMAVLIHRNRTKFMGWVGGTVPSLGSMVKPQKERLLTCNSGSSSGHLWIHTNGFNLHLRRSPRNILELYDTFIMDRPPPAHVVCPFW